MRTDRTGVLFLVLGTVFGLAFALGTPPLSTPDEHRHLARIFMISEGQFQIPGGAPGTEVFFPSSILELQNRMRHSMPTRPPRRYSRAEIRALHQIQLRPEERQRAGYVGLYPPVAYAPQALALLPGRLASATPVTLLLLARLGNLLGYLALGTLALHIVPARRHALALWMLLPMSLAQASSASPDGVTFGLAALTFAALTRAMVASRPLMIREGVTVLLCAALLGLAKPGYAPLGLLALAIPVERFSSRVRHAGFCAGVVTTAMVPGLLWHAAAQGVDPSGAGQASDVAGQLRHLWQHPWGFPDVLLATLQLGWDRYLLGIIGVLGHLNVYLPMPVYFVLGLGLVCAARADIRDPIPLGWQRRALLIGLFVIGSVGIFALAYIGWNTPGREWIQGVQGRYLSPWVPLLLLAIPGGGRVHRSDLDAAVAVIAALGLASAVLAGWNAFYGA